LKCPHKTVDDGTTNHAMTVCGLVAIQSRRGLVEQKLTFCCAKTRTSTQFVANLSPDIRHYYTYANRHRNDLLVTNAMCKFHAKAPPKSGDT
jgi:hypothetical protein